MIDFLAKIIELIRRIFDPPKPAAPESIPPQPETPASIPTPSATVPAQVKPPVPPPVGPSRPASGPIIGIDVSHHNGALNWPAIARGGVKFAFIKATESTGFVDPKFNDHVKQAQAAGILVGAYHFFRPLIGAKPQAEHFLRVIGAHKLDLPPVLDWEVDDGAGPMTQSTRAIEWLQMVEAATKRTPIVYTGPSFFTDVVQNPPAFARFPLWIAHYTSNPEPIVPRPWKGWTFWQTTETGHVSGVANNFDVNRFKGTIEDLRRL